MNKSRLLLLSIFSLILSASYVDYSFGMWRQTPEEWARARARVAACEAALRENAGWASPVADEPAGPAEELDSREETPPTPVTFNITTETMENRYGVSSTIGPRSQMEDTHTAIENPITGISAFFGVYDGHGGKDVSRYLEKNLASQLFSQITESSEAGTEVNLDSTIKAAFEKINNDVLGYRNLVGSTAITAFIHNGILTVANVGDSMAVLVTRDGKAIQLSNGHRPTSEPEWERVRAVPGAFIVGGRVSGRIAVSRAFGDSGIKGIIAEPEITHRDLEENDELLIIACDGLWDFVKNERAAEIALQYKDAPGQASRTLVNEALVQGTSDNVSVIVINLKAYAN